MKTQEIIWISFKQECVAANKSRKDIRDPKCVSYALIGVPSDTLEPTKVVSNKQQTYEFMKFKELPSTRLFFWFLFVCIGAPAFAAGSLMLFEGITQFNIFAIMFSIVLLGSAFILFPPKHILPFVKMERKVAQAVYIPTDSEVSYRVSLLQKERLGKVITKDGSGRSCDSLGV